jgi:8-oxo-dGTP diphosphatase
MNEFLHVVAGVIYNAQDEVLIAHRPKNTHQGGLWEFPGGKCEKGENAQQALIRELQEEIDIQVQHTRPLIRIFHTYPDKKILLDVFHVEQWQGKAWGREGQTVQWTSPHLLKSYHFPDANVPIITAIQLPSQYLITPEPAALNQKTFFYHLQAALDQGIKLVQLRSKALSERDYCHYAEKVLTQCDRHHAQLLINAEPKIALSVGTNGVHLNSQQLWAYTERPLNTNLWTAASCHTEADIEQANRIGIDFIVLGAVQATLSHPEASPLGWFKFFQFTEQAYCPVFALGGMKTESLPQSWAHGAQGIAAIRALFGPIKN